MTAPMTTPLPADRRTRRGGRRLAVLGLAALAGLATWAVVVPLLAVPLAARTGRAVTILWAVSVAVAAVVAGAAGWLALALLERVRMHARRVWTVLAGVVLVLSRLGPLGGVGGGAIGGLLALHLVVGLTLI